MTGPSNGNWEKKYADKIPITATVPETALAFAGTAMKAPITMPAKTVSMIAPSQPLSAYPVI